MEIFKDIEDYENYQISNYGTVKSLKYGKERILKLAKDKGGYLTVDLFKQGKHKMCKVHRLVAQAFIPNPNNYLEVNHKDENPANNRANNLEWCDRKYNINFGTRTEKCSKQVLCLETGVVYPSTHQVERQLGFAQGYISNACNGKCKQAYGFHWCYV